MADSDRRTDIAYHRSASLADLINTLRGHGLLEGEVRRATAEFLERFRDLGQADDPHGEWHADFYDLYVEIVGREP